MILFLLPKIFEIIFDEVSQQLSRLQSHKSAGPDQCHLCVIQCSRKFSNTSDTYLRQVFERRNFTQLLEGIEGAVVAIHKMGSKRATSNHRPCNELNLGSL